MRQPENSLVLPFGITALELAVVTFISAFFGILILVGGSKFFKTRFLAAFAFGVYLWYFTDTLGGANYLNVNGGLAFSVELVLAVVLFTVGLLAFFALDGKVFAPGEQAPKYGMMISALVAIALGLHGAGEGADFGYTAAQTPSSLLLGAFGGINAGASWVLHKMLEPTIIAACCVAFAGVGTKKKMDKVIDALTLAAIFVMPVVVGSVLGYYTSFDHSYIFALGLGASIYAATRVARPMFLADGADQSWLSVKMSVAALIGFLMIFMAALLHS
jgi:hypothetical protein